MASAQFCRFVENSIKVDVWRVFRKWRGAWKNVQSESDKGLTLKTTALKSLSVWFHRKLKEDKEEIEEQRRLRQEEEERSLVTVSWFTAVTVIKWCGNLHSWHCFRISQGRRAKRERRSLREKQRRRAHDVEQSPPRYLAVVLHHVQDWEDIYCTFSIYITVTL